MDAHEQIQQAQLGGIRDLQRGSAGELVHGCVGVNEGVHGACEADEQHDTADQCGVCKVHADAAEQLLDHHDGHQITDDELAQRHPHRHIHGQNDAGDDGGQVADGVGLLEQLAVQPLKADTGDDGDGGHQQCTPAKNDCRGDHAGGQGDDHVCHQAGGRLLRAQVRGGRNNKPSIHYLLPPFLISPR